MTDKEDATFKRIWRLHFLKRQRLNQARALIELEKPPVYRDWVNRVRSRIAEIDNEIRRLK